MFGTERGGLPNLQGGHIYCFEDASRRKARRKREATEGILQID